MTAQEVKTVVEQVAVETTTTPAPKYGKGRCQNCGKWLNATAGEVGTTCLKHMGHMRQNALQADAIPEGYIRMSLVCRYLESKNFKTHAIVKCAGGDGAVGVVGDELFRVTYVGSAKYMNAKCATEEGVAIMTKYVASAPAIVRKPKAQTPSPTPAKPATASASANIADALKQKVVKK